MSVIEIKRFRVKEKGKNHGQAFRVDEFIQGTKHADQHTSLKQRLYRGWWVGLVLPRKGKHDKNTFHEIRLFNPCFFSMSCIQATTTYKPSLGPAVRRQYKRLETVYCASLSSTFDQKSRNFTCVNVAYSPPKYKRLTAICGIGGASSAGSSDDLVCDSADLMQYVMVLQISSENDISLPVCSLSQWSR
ncbi:hypothetical protein FCM35_KLT18466 [Carex littledalei]|uniref:Uncharacterized protein n=1 Tax=Carex littledalei TaxID=544730 RepID=A0A833RPE7_9POAL|nr:hypothetical protein FCM35_KLT18466 [Carex littledalei]